MRISILLALLVMVGLSPVKVFGQGNTERGAVIGGLGGALAGAAIGKHNGETAVGALIGGAAGLVAGSAIGKAQDNAQARQQAYYQQQWQQQQQQALRAVSTQDVVLMTQQGVDPQIIITQIHRNGVARRLEVADVIALHQQGVSEPVISALQNAPLATVVAPAQVYSRPVVVQHYVAPAPVYYHTYPHYHHHHHRHGHHRGGAHVHAGVVIGH
jgi:outer membrane lipoprotein SlyB